MKKFNIKALALLGTLKTGDEPSNTDELIDDLFRHFNEYDISTEKIRLANLNLPVGLLEKMSDGDDWPRLANAIREADIVIFATPIWWGGQSSLIQRVIERMTHFDESYVMTNKSDLYHKVAGIVITGHEDGVQHIVGNLSNFLQWLGFVIPPEAAVYWVGEVGGGMNGDADKRRQNKATKAMIAVTARNLMNYAMLIKNHKDELLAFQEKHFARVGTRGGTEATMS
ncbi:MAG: NAD(P)H-dependent oxidoreductase [Candidatus Niyogibacteria bacterium]|nr:MAG: NAD(P)H-dependent oxidoreductase [Candidatus Niyogibacteria bacterium]